jgi:signal transduction histidine kinase
MTVVYAHARGAAWAADIAVAGGVAVAMTLTISVAQEVGATRSLDGLAYVLGLAIGLVLLARRRWPMQVFVVSVGLLLGYYLLDYPGFSAAVPLAVATYTVAAAGHTVAAAAVLLAFNAVGVAWQTIVEGIPLLTILGTYTLVNVALLAAVLLLGEAVRHRRAWAQEVRERLRQAEQHRAEEAARRLEDERFRIARELHDVLAHTIAAVSVQAGVAAEIIADSPDQARRSLQIIREQIREAIGELRAMVGLLRGSEPEVRHAPAPGLGELDTLVRFACRAGVDVECSVGGEVRPLPAAIELTAYRIVQESLTNVVRHAHASRARVLVHFGPSALVLRIEDNGRGANSVPADDGHGVIGMRERATALGGSLTAGPSAGGGYVVSAQLPVGAS